MSVRTDLAIESANYASLSHPKLDGVEISSYQKADFEVTSVSVLTHEAAKKLSKPTGKYVTLQILSNELDSHPQRMIGQVELFAQELRNLAAQVRRHIEGEMKHETGKDHSPAPRSGQIRRDRI